MKLYGWAFNKTGDHIRQRGDTGDVDTRKRPREATAKVNLWKPRRKASG